MTTKPPIREWRIRNLKAVEEADLELARLTVIVGSNSSGKSTVLQSILLAVQAAQAQTPGEAFPLNGLLAQLGEFKDAHSAFATSKSSSIGGVFGLDGARTERWVIDWNIEFKGGDRSQIGSTKLIRASLSARTEDAAGKQTNGVTVSAKAPPTRSKAAGIEPLPLLMGPRSPLSVLATEATAVRWPGTVKVKSAVSQKIEGLSLTAGVPSHYLLEVDENEQMTERWVARAGSLFFRWRTSLGAEESTPHTSSDPTSEDLVRIAVKDIRDALKAQADGAGWTERSEFRQLVTASAGSPLARSLRDVFIDADATERLRAGIRARLGSGRHVVEPQSIAGGVPQGVMDLLATGVTYLGPLRQEPQVVYKTYSPAQPRNIGSKGEYAAPVMYRLRDSSIVVPMPGEKKPRVVTLKQAVNAWLAELGAASSIEVVDTGRLGYDVRVAQPGLASTVDLTAVGVGVSQVVPVILACLLSEPGGVVLLEQPELHLHPAMQQRLADFFLALAESGRQLLVETHSEYLITRLRLRVAEDRTNHVADQLCVINASKKGPRTEFKQVTVNRYGSFEEWPEGFFDQAAEDSQALLLEGLRKKAND